MKVDKKKIDRQLRFKAKVMFFVKSRKLASFKRKYSFFAFCSHMLMSGRRISGLKCETTIINKGSENPIKARIYRPKDYLEGELLPGVLWLHGGGFALGAPGVSKLHIKTLMKASRTVIISPDYRLSTNSPYPAAFNDCRDTLLWMKENAGKLGIRDDQIMVGGESAGGALCAALSVYARDSKEVSIAFQMPLYPMLDDRMLTPSMKDNDAPIWDEATNRCAWQLYLADLYGRDDVPSYAAPGRITDYEGLPPTFTFVGDLEPFRDEVSQYVENLRNAGVPVEFKVYEGAYHGFDTIAPHAEISKDALALLAREFAYAVAHYRYPQIG